METREALREGVRREQQLVDRLRVANVRLADAQIERAWAISSAHQSGVSIRRIAVATDLSPSRVHQVLTSAESTDMPAWLSNLRETDGCSLGNVEMCRRLQSEVKVLRRCIDWLEQIERGESVVVNMKLDTDENTDNVAFDHARVLRILKRIASHLEGWATGSQNSAQDGDNPAAERAAQRRITVRRLIIQVDMKWDIGAWPGAFFEGQQNVGSTTELARDSVTRGPARLKAIQLYSDVERLRRAFAS